MSEKKRERIKKHIGARAHYVAGKLGPETSEERGPDTDSGMFDIREYDIPEALQHMRIPSDPNAGEINKVRRKRIKVLRLLLSRIQDKTAADIDDLKAAKRESDRRNYQRKAAIIRAIISRDPEAFIRDSQAKGITGLTHRRTGFRLHIPTEELPADKRSNRYVLEDIAYGLEKYPELEPRPERIQALRSAGLDDLAQIMAEGHGILSKPDRIERIRSAITNIPTEQKRTPYIPTEELPAEAKG
jgi:hypothetical protein